MVFLLPALFVLSLFGIRFQKCNSKENTYLQKDSTNAIRGIFIILIFCCTFLGGAIHGFVPQSQMNMFDTPMKTFFSEFEQLLYVPLFFYSGFGIFETFKNYGKEYARKIPLQQSLRHFLSYFVAWILFAITALALKSNYSIKDYLLSLVGLSSIGNPTNWFVFVMIILYFVSFVSFRIADKKTAVIINIVMVIFLYFMFRRLALPGSPYRWNSMPAYVFGIIYSYGKERMEKFLFKNKINRISLFLLSTGLLFGSLYVIKGIPIGDLKNAAFLFPSLFFSLSIVSLTSIFKIKNKVLNFIGSNYFWCFILMQLPFIWLQKVDFLVNPSYFMYSKYAYFAVSLVIVVGLAFIGNKVFNYFWNIFAKNHGEASEESNIQLGIVISYIALFVGAIGAFVVTPRVLENLGDTQYGLLSFANSITNWLTIISTALAASYIKFAAKYHKEHKDVGIINTAYFRIFAFSGLGMFIIIVAVLAVLFGLDIQLPQYSAGENRLILSLVLISGINVALHVIFSVFNNFLTYKKQFIFIRLVALAVSFLTFACNLIFSFVTKNVLSISIVAVVLTTISSVITIVFAFRKEKMAFAKLGHKEASPLVRSIMIFSGFILLNAIVDRINGELDKTLLGIMVNAEAVTDYTLAKYFNIYFMAISVAISSTYVPKIHELVTNEDKDNLSKLFLKICRSQMIVIFLVGGGFFAVGREFMNLWLGASKEHLYYYALVPISLDIFCLTVNACIEIQRAMNKHKFRAVLYIGLALVNVAVSVLLIKILPDGYQIWGAFIGTAVSVVCGNIITLNIYNKVKIGLPMGSYFLSMFKHILYAGVGVGAALALSYIVLIPNNIGVAARLLIQGFTFVIIYFVALIIFERKTLIPLLGSIKNRVKAIGKGKDE